MNSSEENRELTPEFFHNYEIFLNLNYLNLGYLSDEKLIINDLDTRDKNGIIEFIINMRQQLEKINIIPWINNIFGSNQDFKNKYDEIYNIYPSSAYEKNNNYELLKLTLRKQGKSQSEIINEIKDKLNLLYFGIIPIQLYKNPLKMKKLQNKISTKKTNNKKLEDSNIAEDIKTFLKTFLEEKTHLFVLDNNFSKKLMIKTKNTINMFPLFNNQKNILSIELWARDQINLCPISNIICELNKDIFLSCRYLD